MFLACNVDIFVYDLCFSVCIHFHQDLVLNFRGKIELEVQSSTSSCGHTLLKSCISW